VPAARPGRTPLAAAALCLAAVVAASPVRTQPAEVDGIVALVGSAPGDEGAATPLLASDAALHAALASLLRGAPAGAPPSGEEFAAAGRQAILLSLLVRDAHQSGEEIEPAAQARVLETVTANAGGEGAFAALLASLGAAAADASAWAGDVALAAAQLAYMREQIEPPSDKEVQRRFAAQDHPFVGRELKEVRGRLRELMMSEQLAAALGALFVQALRDGSVRIVRP
jgi:hypothetical protein